MYNTTKLLEEIISNPDNKQHNILPPIIPDSCDARLIDSKTFLTMYYLTILVKILKVEFISFIVESKFYICYAICPHYHHIITVLIHVKI